MKHKTLGTISAPFINSLLLQGKTIFTLDEASLCYGKTRQKTISFLSDLIKRGVLARIKSGTYLILQTGQENSQLGNWPLIANALAGIDDYYLSYYSAMRLLGMTTHPLLKVTLSLKKQKPTKKVQHITYAFIYTKPKNFWGASFNWVTQQEKVWVSDLERTLLDGFDRPELCGGIKEVVRGLWVVQQKINWQKLLEYAERFHSKAAIKRLGFALETLQLGSEYIPLLQKIISASKSYILFNKNSSKIGNYINRWFLRINYNLEELKASVWE